SLSEMIPIAPSFSSWHTVMIISYASVGSFLISMWSRDSLNGGDSRRLTSSREYLTAFSTAFAFSIEAVNDSEGILFGYVVVRWNKQRRKMRCRISARPFIVDSCRHGRSKGFV
ncbi:hypothetical protein PFISCL1PPCAC_10240, partial [Pristionchus fissidentatus]